MCKEREREIDVIGRIRGFYENRRFLRKIHRKSREFEDSGDKDEIGELG